MAEMMRFYDALSNIPKEMTDEITEGYLKGKGFTSINAAYRTRRMTEVFGPIGFGWWFKIIEKRIEHAGNTAKAFIDIELYVKDPATGEVSQPIVGTGGSEFYSKNGITDETFKMALTDAIGNACKYLGFASEIYESGFGERDKYHTEPPVKQKEEPKKAETVTEQKVVQTKQPEVTKPEVKQPEPPKEPAKETKAANGKEEYEKALAFKVPFGPEAGKTMQEAKANLRFWKFLGNMDPKGDEAKIKCKEAYRIICEAEAV